MKPSKYADLIKQCFALARRPEGVTRRKCCDLNNGEPLDWEGRMTKYGRPRGYKLEVSKMGGHPTYRAVPAAGKWAAEIRDLWARYPN